MADKTVEVSTVSHQQTVMSTSSSTTATLHGDGTGNSGVTCDVTYLRSLQGMTKIAEIVLSLVAFITMLTSSVNHAGTTFFIVVSILATMVSSAVLLLLTTHLHLKVRLPWNVVFVGLYGIMIVLYFAAFIFGAADAYSPADGAAVTLGFFAILAYFGSLVFAVMDWRLSRQMTQQSHGATGTYTSQVESPPAYDAQY